MEERFCFESRVLSKVCLPYPFGRGILREPYNNNTAVWGRRYMRTLGDDEIPDGTLRYPRSRVTFSSLQSLGGHTLLSEN
jgi:hypothetical protein